MITGFFAKPRTYQDRLIEAEIKYKDVLKRFDLPPLPTYEYEEWVRSQIKGYTYMPPMWEGKTFNATIR